MIPVRNPWLVTLLLAPYAVVAVMAAPPEHVHEADADHHHSAAHRHVQPHVAGSHDLDHAQLTDDDDHIVWLDSAVLHQSGYQLTAPAAPPVGAFAMVPGPADWIARPDYDTAPPHGPPRATLSLRAPPFLV